MSQFTIINYTSNFVLQERNISLRKRAKPVSAFGPELEEMVNHLFETLEVASGVGLAAPQVGIDLRLFVVSIPDNHRFIDKDTGLNFPYKQAFINPKIVYYSHEDFKDYEACLSIRDVKGLVPRSIGLSIKAWDTNGEVFKLRAHDFLARVIQHEYDHLNGVLYVDRMDSADKLEPLDVDNDSKKSDEEPQDHLQDH